MKRIMSLMFLPSILITALLWAAPQQAPSFEAVTQAPMLAEPPVTQQTVVLAAAENFAPVSEEENGENSVEANKNSIVSYAMSLLGTPYVWAGTNPDGFDCSGFITHVFQKYDITVPHSSALQAKEGTQVAREKAKVGDLVIFTGTNPEVRKPGHVGIIISTGDDNIEFVHSSSVGGVKVSKVEGTGYSRRFMQIRRIL